MIIRRTGSLEVLELAKDLYKTGETGLSFKKLLNVAEELLATQDRAFNEQLIKDVKDVKEKRKKDSGVMDNVIYVHLIEDGRTLAVPRIDYHKIMDLDYLLSGPIVIDVGIAKLHPKDRYIKAEGRKAANKIIIPTPFKFLTLDKDNTIRLYNEELGLILYLQVNMHKRTIRPVGAFITGRRL